MWDPTAQRLRAHRRVDCPDMPGHGVRDARPFTLTEAIEVIEASIDSLGGRAVVAGHSMGGYLSLAAAARLEPKVAGVVAMGCTAQPSSSPKVVYEAVAGLASRIPKTYDRVSTAVFNRFLPEESAEAFVRGGLASEWFASGVKGIEALDSLADVAAYDGPIWFVNGTFDQMRMHEKKFLAAARHGRLSVWPGLNHLTIMRDPDRLARAIEDACLVVDSGTE